MKYSCCGKLNDNTKEDIETLELWLEINRTRTTVPMHFVEPLIRKLRYYHERNSDYLDLLVEAGKRLVKLKDELDTKPKGE